MRLQSALAAVGVALLVSAGPAAAVDGGDEQRVAEAGLVVSAGYDGRVAASSWQPVAVALEPVRPLAGSLAVTVEGSWGPVAETVRIEVAAGSRKVYRFVVPAGSVRVTLAEDGAEPVTVRPADRGRSVEYLAGLLGAPPASLPPLRSELTSQSGAWVAVDPAWPEQSSFALDPLGALVADVASLQALSPKGRSNLAAGVAAGTDLVVVGDGADLAALGLPWTVPDGAWQVRAGDLAGGVGDEVVATALPAGYGRVVLTSVRPGDPGLGRSGELWSQLAGPNPRHSVSEGSEYRVAQIPHQFARLLSEQGTKAPALPWLGAFVAVYVLVVGPVNGVLLARLGRRELAWATVPMVTVIFTLGAFLGATSARPSTGAAARLVAWNDGAGIEMVAAGVRAPTPGAQSLQLEGADWTARALIDSGRQGTVARGTDTTVAMELTALQLGGVAAWRTLDSAPPFDVAAVASQEGVRVTVRNTSGRALDDIVVRVATSARGLSGLAPGAEETITLGGASLPLASAYRDPFEGLPLDQQGVVGVPTSMRAVLNSELADGRPGVAWVSAVDTSARGPRVRSGGQDVRDHGAVLAVGTAVRQGEGLSPYAIQRDVYSNANGGFRPGPEAVEGVGEVFLRFRLPPGADPTLLSNDLDRNQQSGGRPNMTVWDRADRQWVPADLALTDVDPSRVVSPLGEVWVRASGELFPFEYSGRSIAGGRT